MALRFVLFDFYGTLFDTSPGITRCMRCALRACGYSVSDSDDLKRFIGPPLPQAFREFYGANDAEIERLTNAFRPLYAKEGVLDCVPIEGVEDFLKFVRSIGCKTAVATSKPQRFAVQILEAFDFMRYFDVVCGVTDDDRIEKAEIVKRAMHCLSANPQETLMIGDRKFDVFGAKANGIPCLGINTGFALSGELENAGACAVVRSYSEMRSVLSSLRLCR